MFISGYLEFQRSSRRRRQPLPVISCFWHINSSLPVSERVGELKNKQPLRPFQIHFDFRMDALLLFLVIDLTLASGFALSEGKIFNLFKPFTVMPRG